MATLPQRPVIGRVVRYVLTADDCAVARSGITAPHHYLNRYSEGDEVAGEVVRVFDQTEPLLVNLKCRLDGNVPDLWVTSRQEGITLGTPGTWHWPPRT